VDFGSLWLCAGSVLCCVVLSSAQRPNESLDVLLLVEIEA